MIIQVQTKPNSNKNSIEKISNNQYLAHIKEPAERNKANIKLINLLAKTLKVEVKNIKIKNPKSHNKIIEII